MIDEDVIRCRWEMVGRTLDERGRRLFAAAKVCAAGWGGPDQLHHRDTIRQRSAAPVLRDVAEQAMLDLVPLRGAGG
jgi:hypothetical protein